MAQDVRQRMQEKTFTAWVNSHLSREGMKVENLSKDFADGIKLIKLIEVIAEDNLGKYNKKPVDIPHFRMLMHMGPNRQNAGKLLHEETS